MTNLLVKHLLSYFEMRSSVRPLLVDEWYVQVSKVHSNMKFQARESISGLRRGAKAPTGSHWASSRASGIGGFCQGSSLVTHPTSLTW